MSDFPLQREQFERWLRDVARRTPDLKMPYLDPCRCIIGAALVAHGHSDGMRPYFDILNVANHCRSDSLPSWASEVELWYNPLSLSTIVALPVWLAYAACFGLDPSLGHDAEPEVQPAPRAEGVTA